MIDENLKEYATDRQWEILQAIESEGSSRKAAKKLGINKNSVNNAKDSVEKKAALSGYSTKHDLKHAVPDGFKLRGASTLYNADGQLVMQWVKSCIDSDRQQIIIREMAEAMAETLPKESPVEKPSIVMDSLAACYPVGDHHLGMLSWSDETGDDYDLAIGQNLLLGAIDSLVSSVPSCGTALIALLGDFLHYDSFAAITPSHGHLLDADSRYPKVVRAAIKTVRYMIKKCLEHHENVHVIIEIGNHDPSSSIFLAECLHSIYENETRITIDRSPSHYHYWRFGSNLIGVHHGHGAKLDKLPLIMATDRAKDWGETEYRYWYTGHIHHDSVKDFGGVRCESFRILPPADAYAHNSGYRAGRDMKAIVLHKKFGEVSRYIVNPDMLRSAEEQQ